MNKEFKGTWWHPIKLKPRQVSTWNYQLLEALTWNSRKSLYASMNKYKLDASKYEDVAAYILIVMEKKFAAEFRKKKLSEIQI